MLIAILFLCNFCYLSFKSAECVAMNMVKEGSDMKCELLSDAVLTDDTLSSSSNGEYYVGPSKYRNLLIIVSALQTIVH